MQWFGPQESGGGIAPSVALANTRFCDDKPDAELAGGCRWTLINVLPRTTSHSCFPSTARRALCQGRRQLDALLEPSQALEMLCGSAGWRMC